MWNTDKDPCRTLTSLSRSPSHLYPGSSSVNCSPLRSANEQLHWKRLFAQSFPFTFPILVSPAGPGIRPCNLGHIASAHHLCFSQTHQMQHSHAEFNSEDEAGEKVEECTASSSMAMEVITPDVVTVKHGRFVGERSCRNLFLSPGYWVSSRVLTFPFVSPR